MKIIIDSFLWIMLTSSMSACATSSALAEPAAIDISDSREPPLATLEINGITQEARIGSYCWLTQTDAGEPVEACQDSVAVATPHTPLESSSPVTAQLRFAVKQPPDQISASVFVASDDDGFDVNTGELNLWSNKEGTLVTLQPQTRQEFTLELAPGLYVFQVYCVWDNNGEASYGFLIEVK